MSKIRRFTSFYCLVGLVLGILSVQVVSAQQDTLVRCRFEKSSINIGAETIIFLEVLDVVDLFAYQLDMTFDPVLTEVSGYPGDLEDTRMVFGDFLISDYEVYNEIHNDIGAILMAITQIEPTAPQSGSGELAYGYVSGQQEGTVEFIFEEVILLDPDGKEIPHSQENCTLLISAREQVTPNPTSTLIEDPTTIPTNTPTETLALPSDTPVPSGTWTATQTQPTPEGTQTPEPTATSSPTETAQPSSTPSPGSNDTPTISPTAQPTSTPTVSLTPQPGYTPTSGFSPTPLPSIVKTTETPYPSSTPTVTITPTSTRTMVPEPTPKPSSGFYMALCVTFCFAMLALIAVIMGIIWYIRQAR